MVGSRNELERHRIMTVMKLVYSDAAPSSSVHRLYDLGIVQETISSKSKIYLPIIERRRCHARSAVRKDVF